MLEQQMLNIYYLKPEKAQNQYKQITPHLDSSLQNCPADIKTEWKAIKAYTDYILNRDDLRDYITDHYLPNSDSIDSLRVTQMAHWYAGNIYQTGFSDG